MRTKSKSRKRILQVYEIISENVIGYIYGKQWLTRISRIMVTRRENITILATNVAHTIKNKSWKRNTFNTDDVDKWLQGKAKGGM